MGEFELSQFEYEISLVVGLIAIGHFAYRQLDLPVKGENAAGLELLSEFRPSAIASRGAFLEAYFYFAIALIVFYVFVCFSEVAFNFIFLENTAGANTGTSFDPESGSWPLTVALLIIGLSPSFPILRDIETFFRQLSQHSAGIPRNLINANNRLREISFEEWNFAPGSPGVADTDYVREFVNSAECTALISAILSTRNANTNSSFDILRRRISRVLLLYNWTISPDCSVPWSATALSRTSLIFSGEDREKIENLHDEYFDNLIRIEENGLIEEWRGTGKDLKEYENRNDQSIRDIFSKHQTQIEDSVNGLVVTGEKLVEFLDKLELVFCLLYFSDRRKINERDSVLSSLASHLSSFSAQVTRNLFFYAIITVVATCLIVAFSYYMIQVKGDPEHQGWSFWLKEIQKGLGISAPRILGGCVLYGSAILGAVLFRMIRREAGHWKRDSSPGFLQIGRYATIGVAGWIVATLSLYFLWFLYNYGYYDLVNKAGWELLKVDFVNYAGFSYMVDAVVGALLAVGFVRWLEVIDSNNRRATIVVRILIWSFFMASFCAILFFTGNLFLMDDLGSNRTDLTELIDPTSKNSKLLEFLIAFLAPFSALTVVGLLVRTLFKRRLGVEA